MTQIPRESTNMSDIYEMLWERIREKQAEYDGLVQMTKVMSVLKEEIRALEQAAAQLSQYAPPRYESSADE